MLFSNYILLLLMVDTLCVRLEEAKKLARYARLNLFILKVATFDSGYM